MTQNGNGPSYELFLRRQVGRGGGRPMQVVDFVKDLVAGIPAKVPQFEYRQGGYAAQTCREEAKHQGRVASVRRFNGDFWICVALPVDENRVKLMQMNGKRTGRKS